MNLLNASFLVKLFTSNQNYSNESNEMQILYVGGIVCQPSIVSYLL